MVATNLSRIEQTFLCLYVKLALKNPLHILQRNFWFSSAFSVFSCFLTTKIGGSKFFISLMFSSKSPSLVICFQEFLLSRLYKGSWIVSWTSDSFACLRIICLLIFQILHLQYKHISCLWPHFLVRTSPNVKSWNKEYNYITTNLVIKTQTTYTLSVDQNYFFGRQSAVKNL